MPKTDKHQEVMRARQIFDEGRYKEAYQQFYDLAQTGNAYAQMFLGDMLMEGRGVAIDLRTAEAWLLKAANAGDIWGIFCLATLYEKTSRHDQAAQRYRHAGEAGHLPSLFRLGRLYAAGLGVEKDSLMALQLFERAAKEGHVFSKKTLGSSLVSGSLGKHSVARGLWLIASAVADTIRLGWNKPDDQRLYF